MLNFSSYNQIPEERYICVAVELLQTQDPTAVFMLKKFLTYIPSPTCVKNILTTAIMKLIDSSPAVVCWLLDHSDSLQPEVDVDQAVIQILSNRLENMGFVEGQDFCVHTTQKLEMSAVAQLALSIHSQQYEVQDPSSLIDYLQK